MLCIFTAADTIAQKELKIIQHLKKLFILLPLFLCGKQDILQKMMTLRRKNKGLNKDQKPETVLIKDLVFCTALGWSCTVYIVKWHK